MELFIKEYGKIMILKIIENSFFLTLEYIRVNGKINKEIDLEWKKLIIQINIYILL